MGLGSRVNEKIQVKCLHSIRFLAAIAAAAAVVESGILSTLLVL